MTRKTPNDFSGKKYEITEIQNIFNFVFAGHAIFSIKSQVTEKYYTFKVSKAKDKSNFFFVKLLTGSDNTSSYTYMGKISNGVFSLTSASHYKSDSIPVLAFEIFLKNLVKLEIHPQMTFYHMGICGKCGRPLTVPESIERGIGPICVTIQTKTLHKKYEHFNFD